MSVAESLVDDRLCQASQPFNGEVPFFFFFGESRVASPQIDVTKLVCASLESCVVYGIDHVHFGTPHCSNGKAKKDLRFSRR
jgi:hypothetical protein